jgi:tRNA-binding protein
MTETISHEDFEKVHINVGRIIAAEFFAEAKKPAHKLTIDFGPEIGIKRSSAQITVHYQPEELVGKLVMAVTNFPPKQIGTFFSEVLTLGFYDQENAIVLAQPEREVPLGARIC